MLLDCYFLPDNRILSDLLSHSVSLFLLILLNCSNSVLVRGVYIDAEEPDGQCVIFPVYYIRLFFQKQRTKNQKQQNLEKNIVDQDNNTVLLIEKSLIVDGLKFEQNLHEKFEVDGNIEKKSEIRLLENGEHKIMILNCSVGEVDSKRNQLERCNRTNV